MAHTSSIDILNMLVDAGLDRKKAEPIAKEILTRSEATEMLATKGDINSVSGEIAIIKTRLNMLIGINVAAFLAVLTLVFERVV